MTTLSPSGPLRGTVHVPGDKSVSHRSLMLGGIANGVTTVEGFLASEDCLATLGALRAAGAEYRPGDKVIQLRNNYDKGLFNGDIGTVAAVDGGKAAIEAEFDGARHGFERGELGDLALAYAISIHKSQGSEYPVVIVPLLKAHFMMLQRNLLYTAITRGKKKVLIVGEPAAFQRLFPGPILGALLLVEAITVLLLVRDLRDTPVWLAFAVACGLGAAFLPYGYAVVLLGGTVISVALRRRRRQTVPI